MVKFKIKKSMVNIFTKNVSFYNNILNHVLYKVIKNCKWNLVICKKNKYLNKYK